MIFYVVVGQIWLVILDVCLCFTFLRWTAGQGGEGQVHDVAADDGGLQQS